MGDLVLTHYDDMPSTEMDIIATEANGQRSNRFAVIEQPLYYNSLTAANSGLSSGFQID